MYEVVDVSRETLIEAYATLSVLPVSETSREFGKSKETYFFFKDFRI